VGVQVALGRVGEQRVAGPYDFEAPVVAEHPPSLAEADA
jgi:hypothetical protein